MRQHSYMTKIRSDLACGPAPLTWLGSAVQPSYMTERLSTDVACLMSLPTCSLTLTVRPVFCRWCDRPPDALSLGRVAAWLSRPSSLAYICEISEAPTDVNVARNLRLGGTRYFQTVAQKAAEKPVR